MQGVLDTIRNDVTNSTDAQFAGAGRDLSGLNTQARARGIAQGEAVPLLGQYNANVDNTLNAGSQLFGANYNTAGAITGNQRQGLNAAMMQPGIQQAPALAQLQAAQTAYSLPLSLLVTVLVSMAFCAAYGATIERIAYRPLRNATKLAPLDLLSHARARP
jgi:hypothetical protein